MADHLVIDVDGHVFEPDELWEQYLPARFHGRRPRLITDDHKRAIFEADPERLFGWE